MYDYKYALVYIELEHYNYLCRCCISWGFIKQLKEISRVPQALHDCKTTSVGCHIYCVSLIIVNIIAETLIYLIRIFNHLKLCLATATHNFKCVNITHICLIWDETVMLQMFTITVEQTWDVDPTLVYCWPIVYGVGPTVNELAGPLPC